LNAKKTRAFKNAVEILLNIETYYVSNFEELFRIEEEEITLVEEKDHGKPWPDFFGEMPNDDFNVRVYESYSLSVMSQEESILFEKERERMKKESDFKMKMKKYRHRYVSRLRKILFKDLRSLRKIKIYHTVSRMLLIFMSHFNDLVFSNMEIRLGFISIVSTFQLILFLQRF
jgi:hypothetical protein